MNKIKKILKCNKTKNYAFILLLVVSFVLVNVSASSEIIYKNESYSISSGATKSSGALKAPYNYAYLSYTSKAPYNTTETFKLYGGNSKTGTFTKIEITKVKIGIYGTKSNVGLGKSAKAYWLITDTAHEEGAQYSSLGWYGTIKYSSKTS